MDVYVASDGYVIPFPPLDIDGINDKISKQVPDSEAYLAYVEYLEWFKKHMLMYKIINQRKD